MKKKIYERIFELIKLNGMTQKEFSEATGIPESTISDWKKKGYNPGLDKIVIICKVLGVSLEELLEDESNDESRHFYRLTDDEINILEEYRKIKLNGKGYGKEIIKELFVRE